MMRRESSSRISVLLLDTLRQLERERGASRDDPAVAGLERYVVRLVGELDAIKGGSDRSSAAPAQPPSPAPKILEILRTTLLQMEQMSADHAELGELKDNLIHAIAELEASQLTAPQLPAVEAAGATPERSHSAVFRREGLPPGEDGVQQPLGQALSTAIKKNGPRSARPAAEGLAPLTKAGDGC